MPERRLARAALVAALWLSSATLALAQEGESLDGQTFDLDLVTGPVIGPGRIVGLGGAYVALAGGVEAASWNPAAFGTRGPWETGWFEWDVTAGLVPSTIRSSDFDNDGLSGFTYDSFLFGSIGGSLRFGELGFGLLANFQTYEIGDDTSLSLAVLDYGAGYLFASGQLAVGVAMRTANLSITDNPSDTTLVDFSGSAPEVGAVLQPLGQPFRIGGALRLPVHSGSGDTLVAAGLTLPRVIRLPWEFQAGLAWQLGDRPLNHAYINPHDVEDALRAQQQSRQDERMQRQLRRERLAERLLLAQQHAPPVEGVLEGALQSVEGEPNDPSWRRQEADERWREEQALVKELERLARERARLAAELSRNYLLLSGEVILIGSTDDAVGLESFLSQDRRTSGGTITVGVRGGIEGEPLARWLKMRAGTYLEPSRFEGVPYRVHGTAGFDVKLFTWDLFGLLDPFALRFGSAADVAERYLYVGLGIGIWH
jgi:hypothetical protein